MTKFSDTPEAADFVASAASRETSPEIMEAIAFFARNLAEAEALWNGDGFGVICHPTDLWERVTRNGLHDASDFCWGAAGSHWWDDILTPLELDRANTLTEMRSSVAFLKSLPAERPGAGRLAGQILRRPDAYIADLDAAIASLEAGEWPAPGSQFERALLSWIDQNEQAANLPGQGRGGYELWQRIIGRAKRLLKRVE